MSTSPRSKFYSFAEEVVDYEIQYEKSKGDLSCFKNLITLLVEGIEYYQSMSDDRYVYYKEKMDKLLLDNKKVLKQSRYRSPEVQAEDTIRDNEQKNYNVIRKVHSNLSIQNGSLINRLQIRRKTFTSGCSEEDGNVKMQNKLVEAIEEMLKEKKAKVKEVRLKYKDALLQGNYFMAIEQMNKEVEDVEREIEQKKKELVHKIFSSNSK